MSFDQWRWMKRYNRPGRTHQKGRQNVLLPRSPQPAKNNSGAIIPIAPERIHDSQALAYGCANPIPGVFNRVLEVLPGAVGVFTLPTSFGFRFQLRPIPAAIFRIIG